MEAEAFQKLDPQTFYRKFLSSNVRPDGRSFQQIRDVTISYGVLRNEHVAISTLVTLGDTKVVSAITLQVGQPSEYSPNSGEIEIQVLLTPLCSSKFSVGKPSEQAMVLEALIRDVIAQSKPFSTEDLCIESSHSAWKLLIDVYCLSYDGNITDAALIAVMACLSKLKLPRTTVFAQGEVLIAEGEGKQLPFRHIPIPLTLGVFDNIVITDPSLLEEELISTVITVVQTNDGQLCSLHKPGGAIISGTELATCIALGRSQAQTITASLHVTQ